MSTKTITLDGRPIGDGHPVFLAAEAGTTSNGDLATAKKLTDLAAEAGFDAIKFQTIDPYQLSDKETRYEYDTAKGRTGENMVKMFESLVFSPEEWHELAEYVRSKGLVFFSTVDHLKGVDLLDGLDVPVHKMGSWDVTYEPLIKKMAATGKPVMLDLGPAGLGDVVRYVELYREYGNGEVILLQDFHTDDPAQMNMRNIPYLKRMFGLPVGFSAPGTYDDLDVVAVALGANVLEKRITMSREQDGHHHFISMEPQEMEPWVERMRFAEACLGTEEIRPSDNDAQGAREHYRTICTTRPVKAGEVFSMDNLDGKRPGSGLHTRYLEFILGRPAKRDLDADVLITWDDV